MTEAVGAGPGERTGWAVAPATTVAAVLCTALLDEGGLPAGWINAPTPCRGDAPGSPPAWPRGRRHEPGQPPRRSAPAHAGGAFLLGQLRLADDTQRLERCAGPAAEEADAGRGRWQAPDRGERRQRNLTAPFDSLHGGREVGERLAGLGDRQSVGLLERPGQQLGALTGTKTRCGVDIRVAYPFLLASDIFRLPGRETLLGRLDLTGLPLYLRRRGAQRVEG